VTPKPGYFRKHPDVRWKRTGRAGILLNLRSGEYFELDETGMTIWLALDGRKTVAMLATELAKRHRTTTAVVTKDITSFLATLKRRTLVTTPANARTPGRRTPNR
jgi:hypothetical protein